MRDGASGDLFSRLLSVTDGCLVPDPSRRLTVPQVLDTLTALQRDVIAASGGVATSGPVSPTAVASPSKLPVRGPAAPTYDVLAIVDAMEALAIDAAIVSAVADVIGTSLTASLDVLTANKVPAMKTLAVRKAVASSGPPHPATTAVCTVDEDSGS